MTTRSPVPAVAPPPGQALFTLPPAFRPPFPVMRRGVGQPVRADGSLDPARPDPRPFHLQLEPDGAVRYLDHPAGAELGYLAYDLKLTWGTTAAANDQAVLDILDAVTSKDIRITSRNSTRGGFPIIEDGRVVIVAFPPLTDEIPPELGQLTHLRSLALIRKNVTKLPSEIGQLTRLIVLWLQSNQLTALPPEIGQLADLSLLVLWGNQLTTLPPEIGQLLFLARLYLQSNQLTALPPEIGQLQYLDVLHLQENLLTTLPPEFGQLRLRNLDLSDNQLTTLPPEFGQLQNLNSLNLSSNQLTALPPEFGQLQSLERLKLTQNQLTALPPELGQLQNLTHLDLDENPLTGCLPSGWRDLGIQIQPSEHPPFCTD